MANHKSAIKRHRQSLVKRDRNRNTKAAVRAAIKEARAAITAKAPNAKELVVKAEKLLSSAAKKGTFHKKNAARRTSRLATALAAAK